MEIRKNRFNIFLLILIWMTIPAVFVSCTGEKKKNKESQLISSNVIEKKQYVCSMHPQVIRDKPGDCPICGMSLIEKVVDKNPADSLLDDVVLPVNESVISSIKTINPVRDNLPLVIKASGIINFDTRKIKMISARFGGLIEKSYVKSIFQPIKKGQKIYEIFSPNIYTEHWNYVKLIQTYPDQDNLTVEAREWFKYLGLTEDQIDALKKTIKPDYHLTVYSDADGYALPPDFDPDKYFTTENKGINNTLEVNGIGLNDGMTIETGTSLFKIVDIKSLRADIKVKTEEIGLLRKGQHVHIITNIPACNNYEANISQIEPLNGGVFQLVIVYFKDKGGNLFPGRQIQAEIMTDNRNSIWLPETTIVNMGHHKSVFIKYNNKFIATVIETGLHTGNKIEILSGIDPTSNVALNPSLLIDSDGLIQK